MKVTRSTLDNSYQPQINSSQTDQMFRHLFEILPVAVYTCDNNGYISFYNRQAADLWGREPKIGEERWCGAWKMFTPEGESMPAEESSMANLLKTGRIIEEQEILIERPDATRSNVIPYPKIIYNDNGEQEGAMNMLVDVTQRKKTEENAARLVSIVQSSNAAIVSKTLNGIVTSWNPAAQHIFGYTPKEMIGQSILKIIPHDLYYEENIILDKLRRGEIIEHLETRRLTKDGRLIDVSLAVSPVRDEKGKIIGVSKIARDISIYKEAERTVRELEERVRMAVDATMLGTWDYDPITQKLTLSGECRKIYGLGENEKIDFARFLKYIHPDDYDYATHEVEQSMINSGNDHYDIRFRIIRKNGQVRWVRSQGKVYFNDQPLAERLIGTVLDITDEKNAKEALEQQVAERTKELKIMNKQLQRSNSALAQFASVASHDLQEPLRKVQMYCHRILENPGNSEIFEKYFPRIIASSARMSQLIKDVLHYAQISDGLEEMKDVDLNTVFENVISDLEISVREKEADVSADLLPVIKGNPVQLHQLFSNLISNSIKFNTKKPVIRITSRIFRKNEVYSRYKNITDAHSYVELRFEDNGIGFDQKYATQVFEIFQRLQDRSVYGGTGIGLAVCKKIVENHHGLINVESEPGFGTTFVVLLPIG